MQVPEEHVWWGDPRVRLTVLLVLLVAVAAYGAPKIIGNLEGNAAPRPACAPGPFPVDATLTASTLEPAVAASGIWRLVGGGTQDTEGWQGPIAAWTDGFPSTAGAGGVGYEIRWWSARGEHQLVDLFVFANPAQARAYVRQATSTRCRSNGSAYSTTRLAGGRGFVWRNPFGFLQGDVFFARGDRAYRLGEVGPASDRDGQPLVQAAQQLACALPDAVCRPRRF